MKVVNKVRFIEAILIVILTISVIIIGISSICKDKEIVVKESTYIVSEVETLWNIAKRYKKEGQDIREYIYEIKKLNNMETATIYEGQELIIIVYEEAE